MLSHKHTCLIHFFWMVQEIAVESAGLDDSDQECQGPDLVVPYENLEDDEELRLHILGLQSYWTKLLGFTQQKIKPHHNRQLVNSCTKADPLQALTFQRLAYGLLFGHLQVCRLQQCNNLLITADAVPSDRVSQNALAPDGKWFGPSLRQAAWLASKKVKEAESFSRMSIQSAIASLSYHHFWKTFKSQWSNILRFLPACSHGQCDDCQEFQEKFKTAHVSWLLTTRSFLLHWTHWAEHWPLSLLHGPRVKHLTHGAGSNRPVKTSLRTSSSSMKRLGGTRSTSIKSKWIEN